MNGDYSKLLTDLALIGHRNRTVRVFFFKSINASTGRKPPRPSHGDALVALLSRALDQKLARKISGRQFKRIRHRIDRAIKHAA